MRVELEELKDLEQKKKKVKVLGIEKYRENNLVFTKIDLLKELIDLQERLF